MAKILFLFPPCNPRSSGSPYLAPHLLSTILRQNGHEVTNIDLNNHYVRELSNERLVEVFARDLRAIPLNRENETAVESAIAHFDVIIEKQQKNEPVLHTMKIFGADFVRELFFSRIKTVEDYRDQGLDIHPEAKKLFEDMVNKLDIDDRIVCMSCAFGDQLPFTLEAARLIKKRSPNTKIILGGAQISLLPDEIIAEISRFKLFNLVFTGFAEEKICEVIETCPDTYFTKTVSGTTATHSMLNSLPFTDFDEMEFYELENLPVMVNKGCYWGRCTFCDYVLMGDLGGARYVSRSVEIVFNEIKALREKYPDSGVRLISDAVPPKFYKELCIRANAENFPLRTSSYMINNKNLTEEFFIEASKAKIGMIVFGTESTNDRVLSLMEKQGRRKDILDNLRNAQKHGVQVKVNLIPNYPTTSFQEALQTIRDVDFFKESIAKLAVFKFYLSANTPMDQNPESFDLEINEDIPYVRTNHNGYHSRDFVNKKGMSQEEEDKVYHVLQSIAASCEMNESKKIFKEKFPVQGIKGISLSTSFQLRKTSTSFAIYSAVRGNAYRISQEDFETIGRIKALCHSSEELERMLADKKPEWIEHYFCLGVFFFQKEVSPAVAS